MAMTKKEQAAVEGLKRKLQVTAALRWTEPVAPDLRPPTHPEPNTRGWATCFNRVEPATSSTVYHHIGSHDPKGSWTQQPKSLYSTRLLALKALRNEIEVRAAEELARVDRWIGEESNETSE